MNRRESQGFFQDNKGNQYEVIKVIHQKESKPISSGVIEKYDGIAEFRTACGKPVNFVNGKFSTFDGDVLIKI